MKKTRQILVITLALALALVFALATCGGKSEPAAEPADPGSSTPVVSEEKPVVEAEETPEEIIQKYFPPGFEYDAERDLYIDVEHDGQPYKFDKVTKKFAYFDDGIWQAPNGSSAPNAPSVGTPTMVTLDAPLQKVAFEIPTGVSIYKTDPYDYGTGIFSGSEFAANDELLKKIMTSYQWENDGINWFSNQTMIDALGSLTTIKNPVESIIVKDIVAIDKPIAISIVNFSISWGSFLSSAYPKAPTTGSNWKDTGMTIGNDYGSGYSSGKFNIQQPGVYLLWSMVSDGQPAQVFFIVYDPIPTDFGSTLEDLLKN